MTETDIKKSFNDYRIQLLNLARNNLSPLLARRVTPEDVVQETLIAACKRVSFILTQPEIPVYFKLRKLMFQTISDLERKYLQSQKRDICKEIFISDDEDNLSAAQLNWNMFAASITSPSANVSREERQNMLKNVLNSLSENDRQIIELRHFDGMSNLECAEVLQISPKTSSIRYVRALQKLKAQLEKYSEFIV